MRYRSIGGSFVPVQVERLLVSTQHDPDVCDGADQGRRDRARPAPELSEELCPPERYDEPDFVLVNPTGRFVTGGPMGDTGLTGRKIIVDTYGGAARHGGGAFSGKDPSKVDRSAAYAMRWVAKNIVAAGLAAPGRAAGRLRDRCCPPGVGVGRDVWHRAGRPRADRARVSEVFDLRPAAIIRDLDLLRPVYRATASYGHFGREGDGFTWERTDRAGALRAACGLSEPASAAR